MRDIYRMPCKERSCAQAFVFKTKRFSRLGKVQWKGVRLETPLIREKREQDMPRGRIKLLISVDFLNIEDNASVLYISRWDLNLSVVYTM